MKEKNKKMVSIREMTAADCGQVWELFKKSFSDPWSLKSIEEMFIHKGYHNLVAHEAGRIIGYIGILAVCDEADITNVAVDPDYRRKHLGTELLSELLRTAVIKGIKLIYLEVRSSNRPAIHLYEQAGFRAIDVRKNYYEHPAEDAVIMMWQHLAS